MRNTQIEKIELIDALVEFKMRIQSNNNLGLFDVNSLSQDFLAQLLNLTFNSNFINLDKIQNNYPAIDLGDTNNKIAYQVTSQNETSKIYKTINLFNKRIDRNEYDELKFLILNDIDWSTEQRKNICKKFEESNLPFKPNTIETIVEFEKHFQKLPNLKLNRISDLLSKELRKPYQNELNKFNGIYFDTKLEMKWAKFFAKIDWKFTYKPIFESFEGTWKPKFKINLHDGKEIYVDVITKNNFTRKYRLMLGLSTDFREDILVLNEFPFKNYKLKQFSNIIGIISCKGETKNYKGELDFEFCSAVVSNKLFNPVESIYNLCNLDPTFMEHLEVNNDYCERYWNEIGE